MVKKFLLLAVVLLLSGALVFMTPGLIDLIMQGNGPEPIQLGGSTLTAEEIAISPQDVDSTWVAPTAKYITLNGDTIDYSGIGATVSDSGNVITITHPGTYVFSGELNDGQILVDVTGDDVHIVLKGVTISCSWSAPIYVQQASKIRISAEAGTDNTVRDTAYTQVDPLTGDPSAAIYSNDDLFLCGSGTLTVEGNYREAIHSKNRLVIADLTLNASAPEDVLVGHDALLCRNATVTANGGIDCLKSNNIEENFGYIYIESGEYFLTAACDAIQAEQRLLITGGNFNILTGDGYTATPDPLISRKGIKAVEENVILGGYFFIDAADDALHGDTLLSIEGGQFTLYSADDAISGKQVALRGGSARAVASVQGIVGEVIHLSGGDFSVTALDDGLLARPAATPDDDGFSLYPGSPDEEVYVEFAVSGGMLVVESEGDSLDVRGELKMSGGFVMLNAPLLKGGDPLDYDGKFRMTGGTLVTTGRATFVPELPIGKTVCVLDAAFTSVRHAGELISLRTGDGNLLFAVSPAEDFYNLAIYSCDIGVGTTCALLTGGSASEEEVFGVVRGGELTGASTLSTFSITGQMTKLVSRADAPIPDDYPEGPIL